MKRKELLRNYYDRIEEIQRDVDEYVEIFNNMRPHQRLGIQTPSEVEQDFAEKNKRVFWTFQQKVSKIPLQYQMVGIARFELATFCPPDKRANQAALYPE